jgi:hypothetical protein
MAPRTTEDERKAKLLAQLEEIENNKRTRLTKRAWALREKILAFEDRLDALNVKRDEAILELHEIAESFAGEPGWPEDLTRFIEATGKVDYGSTVQLTFEASPAEEVG